MNISRNILAGAVTGLAALTLGACLLSAPAQAAPPAPNFHRQISDWDFDHDRGRDRWQQERREREERERRAEERRERERREWRDEHRDFHRDWDDHRGW